MEAQGNPDCWEFSLLPTPSVSEQRSKAPLRPADGKQGEQSPEKDGSKLDFSAPGICSQQGTCTMDFCVL